MEISRREFLSKTLFTGAAGLTVASLPGFAWARFAWAQNQLPRPERFFVLIRVSPGFGGMDVTLGLDPWLKEQRPDPSDMFIEYRHDELLCAENLFLGPAASPLIPHAKDVLALNGIMMSEFDNGHPAANTYISTGNGQGKSPDLPVEIGMAGQLGAYGLVCTAAPYLGSRRAPYVFSDNVIAARSAVDPAGSLRDSIQGDGLTPLEQAIREVVGAEDITHSLNECLNEMEKGGALEAAHVIAAAFLSGASGQSLLDIFSTGLDTHADHEGNHLRNQKAVWENIAKVFALFKSLPWKETGESLFDRTTFLVVSDFARTPALNSSKGKDHNPMTNSVLFAGAGIQGGKSVGASLLIEAARSAQGFSYHMASPFDFTTGQPAQSRVGAEFVYPEHMVMAAAQAAGADLSKFRSIPGDTQLIPGIVKKA